MNRISRRSFLHSAGIGLAAGTTAAALGRGTGGTHPNIIVIISDDHRYDALGCMGNPVIRTPVPVSYTHLTLPTN